MSIPKEYGLGEMSDWFARCPATKAEVTDQWIVYKTKSRSDYWFGNYLVSQRPVTLASLPQIRHQWLQHFAEEKEVLWQIIEWEVPYEGVMPDVSKIAEASLLSGITRCHRMDGDCKSMQLILMFSFFKVSIKNRRF
jgi:hypothetical protein